MNCQHPLQPAHLREEEHVGIWEGLSSIPICYWTKSCIASSTSATGTSSKSRGFRPFCSFPVSPSLNVSVFVLLDGLL